MPWYEVMQSLRKRRLNRKSQRVLDGHGHEFVPFFQWQLSVSLYRDHEHLVKLDVFHRYQSQYREQGILFSFSKETWNCYLYCVLLEGTLLFKICSIM